MASEANRVSSPTDGEASPRDELSELVPVSPQPTATGSTPSYSADRDSAADSADSARAGDVRLCAAPSLSSDVVSSFSSTAPSTTPGYDRERAATQTAQRPASPS